MLPVDPVTEDVFKVKFPPRPNTLPQRSSTGCAALKITRQINLDSFFPSFLLK